MICSLEVMSVGFRNEIYYNSFGNLLATCGFGNIAAGKVQIWDVETHKEVITIEVPDTTYFEWSPDGQHFLTATTSPRMRTNNNYRIWSYRGHNLVEEHPHKDDKPIELGQVRVLNLSLFNDYWHFADHVQAIAC